MRYAVVGDIHGNLEAFRAVLSDAESVGCDRVLCVGDIVGYGASPRECLRTVAELDGVVVAGNHDCAAAEQIPIDYFNADARDSILWTRQQLTQSDRDYLAGLPLVQVVGDATIVHGSPYSPEYFDYIQTLYDVRLAFDHVETQLCFVGHSHQPVMFVDGEPIDYFLKNELDLTPEVKVLVNVGSVGQPRDLDPKACYVIYDEDRQKVTLRRVAYDFHSAAERMVLAGLPATNAARIVLGR